MTKTATDGYERSWSPAHDEPLSAVVVGSGVRGGLAAEILQSQGWEAAVCDEASEVALDDDPVALVIFIEKSLVEGVRKMKLLGPAPERPPERGDWASSRSGRAVRASPVGSWGPRPG